MSADLTRGEGTFAVHSLDSLGPAATDGCRIVDVDNNGQPVLDLYTVPYQDQLPQTATAGAKPGIWTLIKLLVTQALYFLLALQLLLKASKRAKTRMARWQLVVGAGSVVALWGAVVITIVAILVALGLVTLPDASGTLADAVAIGATGFTSWVLAKATPVIGEAASRVQQIMDYAGSQQAAVKVANCLGDAIDAVLESAKKKKTPTPPVFILGYSMGALVAFDFLFPRESQLELRDDRHAAIRALITIGCPLDFTRLYLPKYTDDRVSRVSGLPWINIFIPADVLGSNCADGNDSEVPAKVAFEVPGMGLTHIVKFTDEELTWSGIWAYRGFVSHSGYWSVPGAGNCLGEVLPTVLDPGAGRELLTQGTGPAVTKTAP